MRRQMAVIESRFERHDAECVEMLRSRLPADRFPPLKAAPQVDRGALSKRPQQPVELHQSAPARGGSTSVLAESHPYRDACGANP